MPLSGSGSDRFTKAATYRDVQLAGTSAHWAILPLHQPHPPAAVSMAFSSSPRRRVEHDGIEYAALPVGMREAVLQTITAPDNIVWSHQNSWQVSQ
jgi:hypothetical protein